MGRSLRRLLRLLKLARKAPQSTQSTSKASAALPSSGFAFIDNSQGASAAVAELSDALVDVFEDLNLEGILYFKFYFQLLTNMQSRNQSTARITHQTPG